MTIVSCAGDIHLCAKLLSAMQSRFSPQLVTADGDEITIDDGIKLGHVKQVLQEFLSVNAEFSAHTLTEFDDVFVIGVMRSVDDLLIRCEYCPYVAQHEDELVIHKRIHALLKFI